MQESEEKTCTAPFPLYSSPMQTIIPNATFRGFTLNMLIDALVNFRKENKLKGFRFIWPHDGAQSAYKTNTSKFWSDCSEFIYQFRSEVTLDVQIFKNMNGECAIRFSQNGNPVG